VKFGKCAVEGADGAILTHAVAAGSLKLRKGQQLNADDIMSLRAAGVAEVVVARLSDDDIDENNAAARIASALRTEGIQVKKAATGRVNLHAVSAGLFTVDAALVDAVNAIDPAITLATLANFTAVEAGQMVATVKIIPFAVADGLVKRAEEAARSLLAFGVAPFRSHSVVLVQTVLPSIKDSVLDKTVQITEARLARSGSRVSAETRMPHDAAAVAAALKPLLASADMAILFGASAMSDPADVIPEAIRLAGGTVERAGMPVDPGNLLVLGHVDGKPVLGAPGCARSPKVNGFDWVLDRVMAGLSVTGGDIAGMGVGGLLMEIPTRPQPREAANGKLLQVGAILLAAGRSSRMGGPNKLLAEFNGVPLIRLMAERVAGSRSVHKVVVLGNQAERMRAELGGVAIGIVENPAFATGLASSLKAGVATMPADISGALVVLADMPGVTASDLDRLIAIFRSCGGRAVVRAVAGEHRGNPVLLPRILLERIGELEGDTGARHLIETGGLEIIDVDIGDAARVDVDTPQALAAAGGILRT